MVDPQILYQKNYSYVSATSSHFVNHLKVYAQNMIKRFDLKPDDLVADIGSNDGTCLGFFKDRGMRVVGVDPAIEIAEKAKHDGIEPVVEFFGYDLALELCDKYGPAKYITSHNACAHIDDLLDVVKGVNHWLDDNGIFVLEVGYFVDVYRKTLFDTIYHEHLDYQTVAPFEKLFARVDMEVFDVQQISPQGGSIRLMVQKCGGKNKRENSVDQMISLENGLGLDRAETLNKFDLNISSIRDKLEELVHSLKAVGKSIAGFGAPTKATTLMLHFGIGENELDFIVDDNPLKQGLYTPISHIPISPATKLYEKKPDYVLILAWNFADSIMAMHKEFAKKIGQFILPLPEPEIVKRRFLK